VAAQQAKADHAEALHLGAELVRLLCLDDGVDALQLPDEVAIVLCMKPVHA
jgi:hypothetical protein